MIRRRPKRSDDGAGDQDQQQRRQELDDADEAEVERIAGEIVDLPADRDRDDLGGEGGQKARRQKRRKALWRKAA